MHISDHAVTQTLIPLCRKEVACMQPLADVLAKKFRGAISALMVLLVGLRMELSFAGITSIVFIRARCWKLIT